MQTQITSIPARWLAALTRLSELRERLGVALAVRLGSSPAHVAEVIRGFQATESDGVWHLHRGIRKVESPRERAIVFGHCLEEEAHADAFADTYGRVTDGVFRPVHFERQDLDSRQSPAWKTFAYVHVGEIDATQRFRVLAETLPPGALRSCLETVVGDEEGHVDLTFGMLERLGAAPAAIRREVRRVRLRRAWEAWLRLGRGAIDRLATAALSLAYFAAGPLLASAARRKLASGSVTDTTGIKRL